MITTCPHCQTRFRVAAEQLAARRGQVRCGRCSNVFNGFAYLAIEKDSTVPLPAPIESVEAIAQLAGHIDGVPPRPVWTPALSAQAANSLSTQDEPSALLALPAAIEPSGPVDVDDLPAAPTAHREPATAAPTVAKAEEIRGSAAWSDVPTQGLPTAGAVQSLIASLGPVTGAHDDERGEVDGVSAPPHTPMRRAEAILFRPELYQRSARERRAWWAGAALLLLAIGLQTAYLLRTEITAAWPQTRPTFTAWCAVIGCRVPLPREIDLLNIEASEFQADPVRANVVLVTAIVRNRGDTLQAYPNIEITLTDTLDRPLAWRSLRPADYVAPPTRLGDGFAADAEVVARTAIDTAELRPAGYRLRLYY